MRKEVMTEEAIGREVTGKDAIRVAGLSVSYEKALVLENLSLSIPKGKISIIIGSNGCGKSTLLKTIGRMLKPVSGEIYLNGNLLRGQKQKEIAQQMAVLPQSPKAPEGITVGELAAFGRYPYQKALSGLSKKDREIIERAISDTGLSEFKDRPVDSLSGGQRQRAWIAMTLAQETDIILLDEPTTYLDMAHQLEILTKLKELNKKRKCTIVMVLHELNNACRFADNIIGMARGKIVCQGSPLEVINKDSLRQIYGIEAKLQLSENQEYPVCTEVDFA